MRLWMMIAAALLVFNVSACGTKGKLKSPSQIEADEAKKAHKAEKEKEKTKGEMPPPEKTPEEESSFWELW